jgi:hypothetical protein
VVLNVVQVTESHLHHVHDFEHESVGHLIDVFVQGGWHLIYQHRPPTVNCIFHFFYVSLTVLVSAADMHTIEKL